jgi:hypothetical protein
MPGFLIKEISEIKLNIGFSSKTGRWIRAAICSHLGDT